MQQTRRNSAVNSGKQVATVMVDTGRITAAVANIDPSYWPSAWASAHRGKWGQLTPLEKWMKK